MAINEDYLRVFAAINQGYVFSDEKDEDDFMVLVDENREIDESFKLSKSLIADMETQGLIEAIEKETKREYFKFKGKKMPFSLISIYRMTDKAQAMIAQDTDKD